VNGLPYVYTPRPGERVKVDRNDTGEVRVSACAPGAGAACIPVSDVPGVAAGIARAMHEAARLPAPVILERPEHPRTGLIPGVDFRVRRGGVDVIRLAQAADSGELHDPDAIITFAASLAILAGEAGSAPDPAEVEELARVLAAADSGETVSSVSLEAFARAALRWQAGKQQRGESRDG
jgi:hypothetical protein